MTFEWCFYFSWTFNLLFFSLLKKNLHFCLFTNMFPFLPFCRTYCLKSHFLLGIRKLKLIFTKSVLNYIPLKLGSGKWSQRRNLGYVLGNFYLMLQGKHVKIKLRMKEILFQAMSPDLGDMILLFQLVRMGTSHKCLRSANVL